MRALVELYDRRLRKLTGQRLAKLSSLGIVTAYAVTMLVLSSRGAGETLDAVALRAVGWLSWMVAGMASYSAARNFSVLHENDGIAWLVSQRGYPSRACRSARRWAVAFRISLLCGIPALALVALAVGLSRPPMPLSDALMMTIGVCGYLILLGAVLAWIVDWSDRLGNERGGAVLICLVLGPHLARQIWPITPSIPAFFGWLMDELIFANGAS
jgi:hypothetical protein